MGIVLFKEITTEDYLKELEAASERYAGLWADMNNDDERRYIKEQADNIKDLVKKVDRKRIDLSRDYKKAVEAEAGLVISRLEAANLPFTALIDEHTEARKKILAEQKAIEDAKALVIEIANCHDEALMINEFFAMKRAEEVRQQQERDDVIRADARAQALREAESNAARVEQIRINAEMMQKREDQARENDTNHRRDVNRKIVAALAQYNVDETLAKFIVTAIAKGEIPNLKINY